MFTSLNLIYDVINPFFFLMFFIYNICKFQIALVGSSRDFV